MKPRRWISPELALVLFLVLILVGATAYLTSRQAAGQAGAPAHSTYASTPAGARALYLWLEELGFRARRLEGRRFALDDAAQLLFVLGPAAPFSPAELREVRRWVEQPGHRLVVAARLGSSEALLAAFDLRLDRLQPSRVGEPTPAGPRLALPPQAFPVVEVAHRMGAERDDLVVELRAASEPILISVPVGQGELVACSVPALFSNRGLQDGTAALLHRLVSDLPANALVLFDEVHHGYGTDGAETLGAWLLQSSWGWGLFYGAAVIVLYLALQGRRFGRAEHPVPATARRPQREYVVSMASLLRRARHPDFVLRHHRDRLRRELARRWRLPPDLADEAFVEELARVRDGLDATALLQLMHQLSGERASDAELARLVADVDRWVGGGVGRRG